MAHILVTGGAGNIGSALIGRLVDREDTLDVVADNLLTGDIEKLPKNRENVRFVKCDVNDHDDTTCNKEFGLDYTIFRFINTYGPNQSEDFVLPRFVHRAMRNEDITVYGDGGQTRTFCFVDDTVDSCLNALFKNMYVNDIVNVGGEHEITILELAKLVIRVTGSRSRIVHLPPLPEGDMTRRRPDVRKMKQLLNREPITVEDGIARLVAHYRAGNKQ